MKTIFIALNLTLALAAAAVAQPVPGSAQPPACDQMISWQSLDGSAMMFIAPGGFSMAGTAGQPDVGYLVGEGGLEFSSGFWSDEGDNELCTADFNTDGLVSPDDLSDYIAGFFEEPANPATDVNHDGVVNPDDLSDYIGLFFAGC